MVHRSGSHKIDHFAHKPGVLTPDCDRIAESLEHERIKLAIFEAARKEGAPFVQPEFKIPGHVIDVAIIGANRKIAVEVQISPMKRDEIVKRVAGHQAAGFNTVWVVKTPDPVSGWGEKYRIPAFQRDLHTLSDGALFVYREGLLFDVIHLMGYSHVTMFFMKKSFKPVHLLDLDYDGFIASVPQSHRWWHRLKENKWHLAP